MLICWLSSGSSGSSATGTSVGSGVGASVGAWVGTSVGAWVGASVGVCAAWSSFSSWSKAYSSASRVLLSTWPVTWRVPSPCTEFTHCWKRSTARAVPLP